MEIVPVPKQDAKNLMQLYTAVTKDLQKNGIHQWDRFYPNRFIVASDIRKNHMFGIEQEGQFIGAIALDENQSSKYESLEWTDPANRPLCIHRLAVHPGFQGKGLGKALIRFAEEYALHRGYTSIRLDVYTGNPKAVVMYERAGYELRGEIKFPFRSVPYQCFEKLL